MATFRLMHDNTAFRKFVEVPRLEWNETIMMDEHSTGETWVFNTIFRFVLTKSRTREES